MRKIFVVATVIAATFGSSSIVSAENAAGHAAVSAALQRQKQLDAIGRGAGKAAEGAHNSTSWLGAMQRNTPKHGGCWVC